MLNFIDISSHQRDIDLSVLPIDAVMVKATEDTYYVNPYCDPKIQQAISMGIPWGFYHFAGMSDPVAEADYFIANCEGYFGYGVPGLDWEGVYTDKKLIYDQPVDWVNAFVRRVHEVKGIWCWIYGNPWRFNQGGVEPNCARWVASYPSHLVFPDFSSNEGEPPETDGLVCAWQFASDGRLSGFDANLDINRYYGGKDSWAAYAGATPTIEPTPTPEPEPAKPQEPEKDVDCEGTHHVVHLCDTVEFDKD